MCMPITFPLWNNTSARAANCPHKKFRTLNSWTRQLFYISGNRCAKLDVHASRGHLGLPAVGPMWQILRLPVVGHCRQPTMAQHWGPKRGHLWRLAVGHIWPIRWFFSGPLWAAHNGPTQRALKGPTLRGLHWLYVDVFWGPLVAACGGPHMANTLVL